jgi:hypothetical protein
MFMQLHVALRTDVNLQYNAPPTPPNPSKQSFADENMRTAADSPNESNADDARACLGFLVYLFADSDYPPPPTAALPPLDLSRHSFSSIFLESAYVRCPQNLAKTL